jgi:hypothetical protein
MVIDEVIFVDEIDNSAGLLPIGGFFVPILSSKFYQKFLKINR